VLRHRRARDCRAPRRGEGGVRADRPAAAAAGQAQERPRAKRRGRRPNARPPRAREPSDTHPPTSLAPAGTTFAARTNEAKAETELDASSIAAQLRDGKKPTLSAAMLAQVEQGMRPCSTEVAEKLTILLRLEKPLNVEDKLAFTPKPFAKHHKSYNNGENINYFSVTSPTAAKNYGTSITRTVILECFFDIHGGLGLVSTTEKAGNVLRKVTPG
jgi:hypothetical protein